jgi:hypothetical protein
VYEEWLVEFTEENKERALKNRVMSKTGLKMVEETRDWQKNGE